MQRLLTTLAAMLTVLLVAACAGAKSAATPSPTSTPVPTGKTALSSVRIVHYTAETANLQFMSFYVALGAGFFQEEGVDVQLVVPPSVPASGQFLFVGRADVAVLQPPVYLGLISAAQPILIFANLLENDPLNLVVRKEVVEARKLSSTASLAERLNGLKGLKVGVAPTVPPRLRALLASVGMDGDRDIEMVNITPGEEQQAFAENRVDALYTHSPALENALVEQGAVLWVNLSRGEFPQVSGMQIHSLVTTPQYAGANPEVILAITRAIYRAQQLIHRNQEAAVDALLMSGERGLERKKVETIVAIYEPAIPQTPDVSIKGIEKANRLYPVIGGPPLDLTRINLADYIAPQFARQAVAGSP
jgi:ABC-type nitrate/sulfonate/bicarbonate transport system substrate-binding protein